MAAAGQPGVHPAPRPRMIPRVLAALRRWRAGARADATAGPPPRGRYRDGPMPMYEALAIGLGCDLASVERHARHVRHARHARPDRHARDRRMR